MARAVAMLAASVAAGGASPGGEPVPDEMFVLCPAPGGYGGIALDYRNLLGHFEDHGLHVQTCGTSAACISFPLLLSVPPSLPDPGQTLEWREGLYLFSIRRTGGSSGDYEIRVVDDQTGRAFSPPERYQYHYRYNVRRGIVGYRSQFNARALRLCGGRLTFEDLRRLRPRLVPEWRHNPALRDPAQRFDGPLDYNIVIPADPVIEVDP